MSTTVDNRVVSMQFDNAEFERKTKTTMSTLDRLKQKLNFGDSAKSLQNLGKTAGAVNMSPLERSVGIISDRFTTLGVIATTALQRITNAAITTGTNMVRALTIEPVMTGLTEYETKMDSIKTILTNTESKGTTLDQVNQSLQELNTYADQTIYNFADMTRNIGAFTAAGVDLDTSVASIKGLANLAAASGSNTTQAATAMYQLSQAIAAGRVTLMDWNSVVNAGMGGELFQNALKDTAKEMGIAVDESVSFRESISALNGESWLTADVLTATLAKFAEDESMIKAATQVRTLTQLFSTMKESVQSGWAQSWEYIIGDSEQATELLTKVSDAFNGIIGPSTQARNEMLKFWNENGGREAVIEGLANVFKGLGNILKPIGEAFRNVFPPMTGEKLVEISESFRDLTENFKIGEGTMKTIQSAFEGVFSVLGLGVDAIGFVASGFGNLLKVVPPIAKGIVTVGGAMGKLVSLIAGSAGSVLSSLPDIFAQVVSFLSQKLDLSGFEDITQVLDRIKKAFEDFQTTASNAFSTVKSAAGDGVDEANSKLQGFLDFIGKIKDALADFGGKVKDALSPIASQIGDLFSGITITDVIGTGMLSGVAIIISKFFKSLGDVKKSFQDVLNSVVNVLNTTRDALETWQKNIKANTLLKIAGAVAILAGALIALTFVDGKELKTGLIGVSVLLAEVIATMEILNKFEVKGIAGAATSMVIMSGAIAILASSLSSLKDFQSWDDTWPALVAMASLMAGLTVSAKIMSKNVDGGTLIKSSVGLLIFAGAVHQLGKAMSTFAELKPDELQKGLVTLGILLAEIAIFIRTSKLGELKNGKQVIIEIATAMLMLYASVKLFGQMDIAVLQQGMVSVTALLIAIAGAVRIMGSLQLKGVAVSVIAIAAALNMLVVPIFLLGSMDFATLAQGMIAIGVALGIMSIALKTLSTVALGGLGAGAGLVLMAAALTLLVIPIKLLGSMPWQALAVGIGAIAAALLILGGATVLLAPFATAMIAVAAALSLFGIAALAIGVGVAQLAIGLASLAAIGAAGAVAIVGALTTIAAGIAAVIPGIASAIASGIITFVQVIAAGAPKLAEAISIILIQILTIIQNVGPVLIETVILLIDSLLTSIAEHTPSMVTAGFNIITAFLQGIAANIGGIVTSAITIVVNFINALAAQLPAIIQAGFNLMINFINGLSTAITTNAPMVSSAIINLITSIIYAMGTFVSQFGEAGRSFITSLANGIGSMIQNAVSKAKEVGSAAANGIKGIAKDFVQAGRNAINGFIEGIGSLASQVVSKAKQIGGDALSAIKGALGIASPSKEFRKVGVYSDEGLIIGFESLASKVAMAARKVGSGAKEAVAKGIADLDALLTTDVDPVIRPVVDLTDAEQKMKKFSRLFGDERFKMGSDTDKVNRAMTKKPPKPDPTDQPKPQTAGGNTTYSYVQNNYSPKALSRKEIYRQTKNQFSSMKKRIGA